MIQTGRWESLAEQQYLGNDIVDDDTYIYIGLATHPAVIDKIDPITMLTVATWPGIVGYNACDFLYHDGTFLYARLVALPTKVVKINPTTMATVAVWTSADAVNQYTKLLLVGGYLYAGKHAATSNIKKIDVTTMLTVATWTAVAGHMWNPNMFWDGTYLYVNLSSPSEVVQINVATMATVNTWAGPDGRTTTDFLSTGGSLYFNTTSNVVPVTVIVYRVDPATMTTVWSLNCGVGAHIGFETDGTYIYISRYTPARIWRSDLNLWGIDTWIGVGAEDKLATNLLLDGTNLLVGCYTSPCQVIVVDTTTMLESSSFTASPGDDNAIDLLKLGSYFYAALALSPGVVLALSAERRRKGNILIDQLYFQHCERMRR